MDYIQFTIAASHLDLVDAGVFWEWLVEEAAADYSPTGSYTLVNGTAVFTLTVAGMYTAALSFVQTVAGRLAEQGFDLYQFVGIRYTDDDLLIYEAVAHET